MVVPSAVVVGPIEVLLRSPPGEDATCPIEVALIGVPGSDCEFGDGPRCRGVDVVLNESDEALKASESAKLVGGETGRCSDVSTGVSFGPASPLDDVPNRCIC